MDDNFLKSGLILVRHGEVAQKYRGICYGRSDVDLSPFGECQSFELADRLSLLPVKKVLHSGLQRTWFLADALGQRLGISPVCRPALQERDYGRWELQPWDDLYARHGDEMLQMLSKPDTYRPGDGETTHQLRDRVLELFHEAWVPVLTVAVTHGGPIAALRGTCRQVPVSEWPQLIPTYGECVAMAMTAGRWSELQDLMVSVSRPAFSEGRKVGPPV